MNCINHPDVPAIAFCRSCGKALCETCRRLADGTVFCDEHVPALAAEAASSPYTAPAAPAAPAGPAAVSGGSPGLAFLLGFIPGVGAIYNGQYVKGLIHVVIFGLLVAILNNGEAGDLEPLFGMMTAVWFFYMAFEAHHTAKKRLLGQPVDEFSSIFPRRGEPARFPVAPLFLIAIGLLFLLNNLEIVRFSQIIRYWPIALIGLGVYLLYERVIASDRRNGPHGSSGVREAVNERH
jgi:Domain of unknown function (DUF5668)